MNNRTDIEFLIYGENPMIENIEIVNDESFVDLVVHLPSFRPFLLDQVVSLCTKIIISSNLKQFLVETAINSCPVICYRLFKANALTFDEIEGALMKENSFVAFYYFQNQLMNFEKIILGAEKPDDISLDFENDKESLNLMMQHGFIPSSIEFFLKYDDIFGLQEIFSRKTLINEDIARWSQFEWSKKPRWLDFLSFSGFFGSIKCFKFLLMNGYFINHHVSEMVICSGQIELFHLFDKQNEDFEEYMCLSSEFYRLPFLEFFINNQVDISAKNHNEYFNFT